MLESCPTRHSHRGETARICFLALLVAASLLWGCELWTLEQGIRQVGRGIDEAEALGMEEAALYHLTVARQLLDAASKQYEQADFPAATQFLDQSERQLAVARRIHSMNRSAPRPDRGAQR